MSDSMNGREDSHPRRSHRHFDVRIGQTDDLPGVAGVGEDFLITGEGWY